MREAGFDSKGKLLYITVNGKCDRAFDKSAVKEICRQESNDGSQVIIFFEEINKNG